MSKRFAWGIFIYTVALFSESECLEPIEVKIWEDKAASTHSAALDLGMRGAYGQAAAHFRTACRLDPHNVKYLNDLGVTEMRMQQYDSALNHLAAAARLDPDYVFTQKNLAELRRHVTAEQFDAAMAPRRPPEETQLHDLMCPRHVSPSHPLLQRQHRYFEENTDAFNVTSATIAQLREIYNSNTDASGIKKLLSAPFVIRKAAQKWGWNLQVVSARMLQSKFGVLNADFYPHNMGLETVHPKITSLSYALRQLEMPDAVFEDVDVFTGGASYIQWNIDDTSWNELMRSINASLPMLMDDRYWINTCLPSLRDRDIFCYKSHWRMVLIGSENAGMFNHRDTLSTASWQMQLKGKKRWHICAPTEEAHMYGAGRVDCFQPDYDSFPNMISASCFQTIVSPGDFIYYPKGYWHQTKNLSPLTVSITDTMVSRDSHNLVAQELSAECRGAHSTGRHIFSPDPSMCKALKNCYADWAEIFSTEVPLTSRDRYLNNNEF